MNTLFVGRRIIRLKSISSTNNFAATLSVSEAPDGTVVITEEQTEGKGQHGRKWQSEKGMNLTATVVFRPRFLGLKQLPFMNKGIAIAVCKTIKYFLSQQEIYIKWPNDIYCENYKLSGILTENSIRGSHIVSYLAGIGINVNQKQFQLTANNAASMVNFHKEPLSLEKVLEVLCENLEATYLIIKQNDFMKIDNAYHKLLFRKDEWQCFNIVNEQIKAKIIRVNDEGMLELEDESGNILKFRSGEISYVV